ncbi:hypothetical protein NPIL_483701 [Nephila pilipes]|uniref:Uncharacterized protein n=1 Tax=Nephila pilipes TaxID=299642 RepID=A0A8X6UT99_NEPPI|nr:hypothetical protein NPIL_483701 [Nephila pilipes]
MAGTKKRKFFGNQILAIKRKLFGSPHLIRKRSDHLNGANHQIRKFFDLRELLCRDSTIGPMCRLEDDLWRGLRHLHQSRGAVV